MNEKAGACKGGAPSKPISIVSQSVTTTSPNKPSSKSASNSFVGGSGTINSNRILGTFCEDSGAKKSMSNRVELGVVGAKSLKYCMKKTKEMEAWDCLTKAQKANKKHVK